MTLNEALGFALEGDALLFTGAGFSWGAENKRGQKIKIGAEIKNYLSMRSQAPANAELQDAAESYQLKFGAFALVDELRNEFTVSAVANHHKILAKIPWMRIFTTNYDNAFEFAANQGGVKIQPVTTKTDPFALDHKLIACVHLNGYIHELTIDALDSTFKLTETSYVTASIADSPWAIRLREDIRLARSVFFIGYSLYDLDIRRILADNPLLREKCFFIIGDAPNPLLVQRIDRYGTALQIGVETFALALSEFQAKYQPRNVEKLNLQSVVEIHKNIQPKLPDDQSVFDLFELGAVDDASVLASISQKINYYLERPEVRKTIDLITGGNKAIVVTGALGNGKSLLLKAIAIRALEYGYRVFDARINKEHGALEFERLAKLPGKTLLIVDNYQNWLREIRSFRQILNDDTRLVVTARDSLHDVLFEQLEDICGVPSVPEIKVDKLGEAQIEWFIETFDRYGLWKSLAGMSHQEKIKLVKERFGSEIHSILLGLLESHDIGERVQKMFLEVKGNQEYLEVVVTIFVLTTLGPNTTIETLTDLWGIELLSSARFRNHQTIKTFCDFNSWQVKVKSSVVSEFVLKKVLGLNLIPILIKIAERTSKAARGVHRYKQLFTELTRYSTIQRLLPENGRLEASVKYFEAIKSLPLAQNYPLFWLQYAIACFVEGENKRARTYFETAYALAERRNFDTYQIDNHYARFLLIEATGANLPLVQAIDNFRQARSIINRQLQNNRLHYPYKMAISYQDFIDRFGKQFSDSICKEFKVAAEYVLEMIEKLTEDTRKHPTVRRCFDSMIYIKKRCDELIINK